MRPGRCIYCGKRCEYPVRVGPATHSTTGDERCWPELALTPMAAPRETE